MPYLVRNTVLKKVFFCLWAGLGTWLAHPARAQRAASNWYFGPYAALRFPPSGPPVPLTGSAMQAPEGCVSVSDSTGQLLFYSNGTSVWNRSNQLMTGGTGLAGNRSATQGVAAVRDPATPRRYYLFTTDASENKLANGLQYSSIDLSRQGGLGEVITKNVRLSAGLVTERVALVPHANGRDTWVLVHGWDNNTFYAYRLTGSGLQPPIATSIGVVQTRNPAVTQYVNGVGYLRASPAGTRLAMALAGAATELFDFDPATGQLANYVPLPGTDRGYGVEFSPDGQLLYLTRARATALVQSTLYQYDLLAGSGAAIAASGVLLATVSAGVGAIQAGPDGRLYVSVDRQDYLGVVGSPNVRGPGCAYQPNGAYLGGKQANSGLPNQAAQPALLSFAATAACVGAAISFAARAPTLGGAVFHWDFGDPAAGSANVGTGPAPTHPYARAGTYLVTLTATPPAPAAPLTFTQAVTVYPLPTVRLPADTLGCLPVQLRPRGSWPAGSTYRWQDGSPGATYLAPAAGTYTLAITTPQGCVAQASARVQASAPPTLALGADTAVCAAARWVLRVGPQPPGTTYRWPDGSTDPTYLAHGPGTYAVEVRGPAGCVATATRTARDQDCPVLLPNVITPNGDARNDAFVLGGLAAADWHLRVFNRWGRLVHDQPSYDNRWQAAGLPAGTYYYLLQNAYTGQHYKGWVEVLRD